MMGTTWPRAWKRLVVPTPPALLTMMLEYEVPVEGRQAVASAASIAAASTAADLGLASRRPNSGREPRRTRPTENYANTACNTLY